MARLEITQGGCRGAESRSQLQQRVISSQAISTSFHPSNIVLTESESTWDMILVALV